MKKFVVFAFVVIFALVAVIIIYSTEGDISTIWTLNFSGSTTFGADIIYGSTIDSRGNFFVCGVGTNIIGSTGNDWWQKAIDNTAVENTTWNIAYDFPVSMGQGDSICYAMANQSEDIYAVGYVMNLVNSSMGPPPGFSQNDWWIKKFKFGVENQTWNLTADVTRDIGSSQQKEDYAYDVAAYPGGGAIVVGYGTNAVGAARGYSSPSGQDWWIRKYNADASFDTSGNFNNLYFDLANQTDAAKAIVIDNQNNFYVVGIMFNGSGQMGAIKKFNSTGYVQWTRLFDFGAVGNPQFEDVKLDSNQNPIIAGYATNIYSNSGSNITGEDIYVAKLNATDATTIWQYNYTYNMDPTISGGDNAYSLVVDPYDNIYVAGTEYNPVNLTWEGYMFKLNSSGIIEYNRTYLNPSVGQELRWYEIAWYNNYVYVSGYGILLNNSNSGQDWFMTRYEAEPAPSAPSGNTCSCPSSPSNMYVDCTSNCTIGNCDMQGYNITFAGAGIISIEGNITNVRNMFPSYGCEWRPNYNSQILPLLGG